MTETTFDAPKPPEGLPGPEGPTPKPRRARTWFAAVVYEVVGRTGAFVGLVWIALVALAAVFGPVIASSHPYLVKTTDGGITSPWLKHLNAADWTLFVMTGVVALLAIFGRRLAWRWILAIFVGSLAVTITLTLLLVQPPVTVVFEQWRQAEAAGEVEWAIHAPVPYSPTDRLRDMPEVRLKPPSAAHWLGTELNGADLLSRMIHASRIALAVGFIATSIALVIGVTLGGLMGYFSKTTDLLGMRLVEIFEAIPQLYLMLTFVAFFGRNLYLLMVIIGLTGWTGYARFTRAEFLKLRAMDYVQASRALGLPLWSILFKQMLPNGLAPVLVTASFGVASAILAESTLSFLGLGLVDQPSWGQMLNQAVGATGSFVWWMAIFPGLAIFLTVFAYNLVGEALRDAIDPHTKKKA